MICPRSLTNIASADGTRGRPGMVMMSPQMTTTNSAPADKRTEITLLVEMFRGRVVDISAENLMVE